MPSLARPTLGASGSVASQKKCPRSLRQTASLANAPSMVKRYALHGAFDTRNVLFRRHFARRQRPAAYVVKLICDSLSDSPCPKHSGKTSDAGLGGDGRTWGVGNERSHILEYGMPDLENAQRTIVAAILRQLSLCMQRMTSGMMNAKQKTTGRAGGTA